MMIDQEVLRRVLALAEPGEQIPLGALMLGTVTEADIAWAKSFANRPSLKLVK